MEFRRLVTVLFADVVESMALAEALDAEALARVLRQYFDTASAVISRHGGTIEKFAGDAVMAVFGIPASHEDDALRAARAALDIRVGMATLNERLLSAHGVGIEVRIGIETGEVVTSQSPTSQRLVTGEVVGIAARLEQIAGTDEIVIGELAGRLIDHAAQLEPLGALEIKGKREPVQAYRLLEMADLAPAFERRLDAPLVGRRRELAALRRGLKRAIEGEAVQVAVVVGPPGVGKSRLAAELTGRAKGVTALTGRCLSYGEGITYWPLREVLGRTVPSSESEAVLAALDADAPPPAAEIAWLFRQFCEARARDKPLVLVFDDVHWAEPTFLELVGLLADRGEGRILVICLARDELLEDKPPFLEARENVERVELSALSAEATDALLEGLGGAVLESDQRARIANTAEGNPFFVEQLLALALEGGLAEQSLPETVQALLAARLDRLGPGERAVLERGSIVLRGFTHDDVTALLEPDAAPTVGAHLGTLVGRGFLRPVEENAFRFRHVIVQDAVYRSAPKRLRAELHERFANRLDHTATDLAELDEFVGYHLERAYLLRAELGESDRRTERLAEDAGGRLGAAGVRAFRRSDMHATTSLLTRATILLPANDTRRRELLCDLGMAFHASRDLEGAEARLAEAIAESRAVGDRRVELRARIELEYIQLRRRNKTAPDDLLEATSQGIAMFESIGDQRALGRAWLLLGWLRGGRLCDHVGWAHGAEQALKHYNAAGWPTSTCLGELAAAFHWGPTPVNAAVARCDQLLRHEVKDRAGNAYVTAFLGGLIAQQRDFHRARELVHSAGATLHDLGMRAAATTFCATVLSEVETLAGELEVAERILREIVGEFERSHELSRLASAAGELANVLALQGRFEESEEWTRLAEQHSTADDLHAQIRWRPVRALIHARKGEFAVAEDLGREAARLADATDDLNRRANAHRYIAEVLRLEGRTGDAVVEFENAVELYEQKGNVAGVAQIRLVQRDLALV